MESYKTVRQEASDEFVEKKSRFIGAISPITTEEEAQAFIQQKKTEHWQATHNCWAYLLKGGMVQRYSDDGEPQGTAGIPILEILRKEEIFDAVIVVTRYYGGIMLGAGGLIRAYSHGAKIALDAGNRVTMAPCNLYSITLPYPLYDRFLSATEMYPMVLLDTEYTDSITLQIRLRSDYDPQLHSLLTELSSGSISPLFLGETFAPIEDS